MGTDQTYTDLVNNSESMNFADNSRKQEDRSLAKQLLISNSVVGLLWTSPVQPTTCPLLVPIFKAAEL